MQKQQLILIIFIFSLAISRAFGQYEITLGPDKIAKNQAFTITVTARNENLRNYSDFPEITGFRKLGTQSSSNTQIINGQISRSQSITQNYAPKQEGRFTLEPFQMTINGKQINSPGKTITVGPAQKQARRNDPFNMFRDPFDDFFGGDQAPQEFMDIKEDAFLALTTNKSKVYVGEELVTTLAFYVSVNNRAPLEFYNLNEQLPEIIKKIKPQNCWEENFNIDKIQGVPVTINGEQYTQYKLFQSAFYPLNSQNIEFPKVELEMIKYKVAKQRTFFGRDRKEDYKKFYSEPKQIVVRELPEHPLRDQVSVGMYRLNETVTRKEIKTGESFTYNFTVSGRGNIASLNAPRPKSDQQVEFYDPNIDQRISRANGAVTGSKSFDFYGIPTEPGEYKLGDYFQWVYFDPDREKYDTLISSIELTVTGESKKNAAILSTDLGGFYDQIGTASNEIVKLDRSNWWKLLVNALMISIIALNIYILARKNG